MSALGIVIAGALLVETYLVLTGPAGKVLPRRFLRWGRNDPVRTGVLVVALHGTWIAAAGAVWAWYVRLAPTGDERLHIGLALTPLLVLLAGVVPIWFARNPGDFDANRAELESMGASRQTARVFYWVGAPFAPLALLVVMVALFTWFPSAEEPMPGLTSCDGVTVSGSDPPSCEVVMDVVDRVRADPRVASGGTVDLVVGGFDCSVNAGVAVCVGDVQLAFDVPS